MAQYPTDDEIIRAVQSTGYLLEQEVATILESLDYFVETNRAYMDIDESKSRELDVYACKVFSSKDTSELATDVCLNLLIGCKNWQSPAVFIGRPKNEVDNDLPWDEYIFPDDVEQRENAKKGEHFYKRPSFNRLGLKKYHYYCQQPSKAVQFALLSRDDKSWKVDQKDIFKDVVYPAVKSLIYIREQEEAIRDVPKSAFVCTDDGRKLQEVALYFPMVVVSGDLYYIDSAQNPIKPVKVPCVTLVRSFDSDKIKGVYRIDFVTKSGLKDFLESKIYTFIQAILDIADKYPYSL